MWTFYFSMKSQTLNPQIYSPQICLNLVLLLPCYSGGDDTEKAFLVPTTSSSILCPWGPHKVEESWRSISNSATLWSLCVFQATSLHWYSSENTRRIIEIFHLEETLGIESNAFISEQRKLRLRKGKGFPKSNGHPPLLGVQCPSSRTLLSPAALLGPRCQTPWDCFPSPWTMSFLRH